LKLAQEFPKISQQAILSSKPVLIFYIFIPAKFESLDGGSRKWQLSSHSLAVGNTGVSSQWSIFCRKFDPCGPQLFINTPTKLRGDIVTLKINRVPDSPKDYICTKFGQNPWKDLDSSVHKDVTIFGLKFDPCGPQVLNIKILKPYFTSTYSVWQYGIEIKCIKWKMKEEFRSRA
jgi:hypothetical protein